MLETQKKQMEAQKKQEQEIALALRDVVKKIAGTTDCSKKKKFAEVLALSIENPYPIETLIADLLCSLKYQVYSNGAGYECWTGEEWQPIDPDTKNLPLLICDVPAKDGKGNKINFMSNFGECLQMMRYFCYQKHKEEVKS